MKKFFYIAILLGICIDATTEVRKYRIENPEQIKYTKKELMAKLAPLLPGVFNEIGMPTEKSSEIMAKYNKIWMVEGWKSQIDFDYKISQKILAEIPEQFRKIFMQITYQWVGPSSIWRDEVSEYLKLSKKQYQNLQRVYLDYKERMAPANRLDFSYGMKKEEEYKYRIRTVDLEKKRDEAILSILTSKQKKAWKRLIGKPSKALIAFRNYCEKIRKKQQKPKPD